MLRMEMSCFMVIAFMGILFFARKCEKTLLHRMFSALLVVSMIHLVFDAATVYSVNRLETVPRSVNDLLHRLFIGTMVAFFYLVYGYVVVLIRGEIGQNIRMLKRSTCLFALSQVLVWILPLDYRESEYTNYAVGAAAYMAYVCVATYLLMVVWLLCRFRKQLPKRIMLAVGTAMGIEGLGALYQAFYPTALLSGMGVMLILLSLYLLMENPDIHLAKQVQIEKEKAELANAYKSVFLSNMSHEIRTPMNAIVGMTDILLRTDLTEEQKDYLCNIKLSGHALLAIINDILDLSKIESGKMELSDGDYNIKRELENIRIIIQNQIGEKGLELSFEIDDKLPERLCGDGVRVRQIMINLLNNAVKFTKKGKITLKVEVAQGPSAENQNAPYRLNISVTDTGQGIKEEDFDKLFEAFEQVNRKINNGKEGTGLGLAISSQLIAMMGGKLQVKSTYGKGSCFYFSILQKPAASQEDESDDGLSEMNFTAPDAKVLVVDDDMINRKVAKGLLQPINMQVDLAQDGKQALKMIAEKEYHIVFMDHMMPVMDGVETTQLLREMENGKYKDLPVVALTANAMKEAEEIFFGAGISDVVTKPIDMGHMCRVLRKWLPREMIVETDGDPAEALHPTKTEPCSKSDLFIEGIDVESGIQNSGSRELFLNTMGDFYILIDSKAGKIRKCLADGLIRDYTIEVHALKNSARLIGAMELSEQFAMLEKAGNEGDEKTLHQQTENVLSYYMRYKEVLKPYAKKMQAKKRKVDVKDIEKCLIQIRRSVDEFDLDATDYHMGQLEEMQLLEILQDDMEKLRVYVADVNMENILEISTQMLAKLNEDI